MIVVWRYYWFRSGAGETSQTTTIFFIYSISFPSSLPFSIHFAHPLLLTTPPTTTTQCCLRFAKLIPLSWVSKRYRLREAVRALVANVLPLLFVIVAGMAQPQQPQHPSCRSMPVCLSQINELRFIFYHFLSFFPLPLFERAPLLCLLARKQAQMVRGEGGREKGAEHL